MAKGIKVTWGTEIANQLTLEFRDYPRLPGWPGVITRDPVSGSWRQKSQCQSSDGRKSPPSTAGFGEGRVAGAREHFDLGSQKDGTRSPWSFQEGMQLWRRDGFSPEIWLGLLTLRNVRLNVGFLKPLSFQSFVSSATGIYFSTRGVPTAISDTLVRDLCRLWVTWRLGGPHIQRLMAT